MESTENKHKWAFTGLTVLFFMWGFITVMNDVMINTFDELFKLKPSELSQIQLAFFGTFFFVSVTYFLISSWTGKDPINKLGYKNGMSISLILCGIGCLVAYIACSNHSYQQFIQSLVIISIGVTLLQICANPYATILGPESTSSSRLNLAQGLNSLGTTLGPIVANILIYSLFSNGQRSLESVGKTYILYGGIFFVMALLVVISKLPTFTNTDRIEKGFGVLKNRHLRFGVIAIFFYVGAEVAVGSWIGKFSKDSSIMGFDEETANYFLAFFWGGLMIGRLMASISLNDKLTQLAKNMRMALTSISIFLLIWFVTGIKVNSVEGVTNVNFNPISLGETWIYVLFMLINFLGFMVGKGKASRMIVIFSAINCVLLSIGIFAKGELAFWSILGTGLFFSIGWSNIFSLSIKGLGALRSQGSSLLVMAIVGGAALPWIQGFIIESFDVQTSFVIPLLAMVYLIFFGLNGYRINTDKNEG